jgi:hypothetical protein
MKKGNKLLVILGYTVGKTTAGFTYESKRFVSQMFGK